MTVSPQSLPRAVDLSAAKAALWLSAAIVFALLAYYFVGIAEHEITEVMGRTSWLNLINDLSVMDLSEDAF